MRTLKTMTTVSKPRIVNVAARTGQPRCAPLIRGPRRLIRPSCAAGRARTRAVLAGREGLPGLARGQRLGGHHHHAVGGRGQRRKVDAQVLVGQLSPRRTGASPLQRPQLRGGMGPQRLPIGQQQVEGAVPRQLRQQLAQRAAQLVDAGHAGVRLGQLLHQPAEGAFAVGVAHRAEGAVQPRLEALQVAVVRKHPVAAPQLAHEGVGVLQRHAALRGLADVGDDVVAADRVALDQVGHRRVGARRGGR